jgi:predicted ArsR family transcriptional regulator
VGEFSSPETAQKVYDYIRSGRSASIRSIGDALGISRSAADRAIYRLISEDRIIRTRQSGGRGYPCQYQATTK